MTIEVEIDIEHTEADSAGDVELAVTSEAGREAAGEPEREDAAVREAEADDTDEPGGVVVGVLLGLADGVPLVGYPGCATTSMAARTTVTLRPSDIGSQVALLFENGRLEKPLVIGKILVPDRASGPARGVRAKVDDDVLTLTADRQIVLECGKASITLTRAGKIILRGTYVLSRSSGVNKIKGGSVQIN